MALAEAGNFVDAVAYQRKLLATAEEQGLAPEHLARLRGNLERYDEGSAVRAPAHLD